MSTRSNPAAEVRVHEPGRGGTSPGTMGGAALRARRLEGSQVPALLLWLVSGKPCPAAADVSGFSRLQRSHPAEPAPGEPRPLRDQDLRLKQALLQVVSVECLLDTREDLIHFNCCYSFSLGMPTCYSDVRHRLWFKKSWV